MNSFSRILTGVLTVAIICIGASASADADSPHKLHFNPKKHPRRAQVVRRADREENKTNKEAVNGKITDKQAKKLDREDNAIKQQEQADSKFNGGHITKPEQKELNREEKKVNHQRSRMEARDAVHKDPPPPTGAAVAPAAGTVQQ